MNFKKWSFSIVGFLAVCIIAGLQPINKSDVRLSRLLVHIDPDASFSPHEFARASSAKLIEADLRNPFISMHDAFLKYPFIVIPSNLDKRSVSFISKRYGYRYLCLTDQSLEQAVDLAKVHLATGPKFSSDIPYLSKEESQRIYELMRKVDRVFTDHGISYWATAGTLLGAVRHQGLIPWDDDLDICIFDSDEKSLKELDKELEKVGLELHYYWKDIYKIYEKDGMPIPDDENPGSLLPYKYPFVDVFVVTLEKNKEHEDIYSHKSARFYYVFNNERFKYSQIKNLFRVPFGPLTIPIPGDPEAFLNSNYGTSQYPDLWKKYAVEPTWIHKTEQPSSVSGSCLVEIDDYAPASY